ncbi:MAG: histidine kinase [Pseudomonadota bacterium]
MTSRTAISLLKRFPYKRFLADFGFVLIFNLICAIVVTYVMKLGPNFWENLLISMCIGTIGFVLIDGLRLLVWGEKHSPYWPIFWPVILLSVPLSQFVGMALARAMLGLPQTGGLRTVGPQNTISVLFFTLLACSIGVMFYTNRHKISLLKEAAATEKARAETINRQAIQAQLQLLQAQIEPHMLFNTLANLQGLIAFDPAKAQHMLDQLILYLRATLSSSRAEHTTLQQEFTLMEAYLGLMSVRMGKRLAYTLHLPVELRSLSVPPMLLQPLVENAIQHGLESKIEGGHIEVSASQNGAHLLLTVSDTGLGLEASVPRPNGTHVGLANIGERLLALFGTDASFSLRANTPCGAVARLTLPLSALDSAATEKETCL